MPTPLARNHLPLFRKEGWLDDHGLRHDSVLADHETDRLVDLAVRLNPVRAFTVTRKVIASTAGEEKRTGTRRFDLKAYSVLASTGAEAAVIANTLKYETEKRLGHHQ